jgi:competence protein ComEC
VLHKEIPFLRIVIPLCAGIVAALYVSPGILLLKAIALIAATGFVIAFFTTKTHLNSFFGYSFTVLLILSGFLLYKNEKNSLTILSSDQIVIEGNISDYPVEKPNTLLLKVKMEAGKTADTTIMIKGSIILYCKKDSIVSGFIPGDRLVLRVTPLEIINRGNPYEFDYRFFMENQGVKYYAFISPDNILSHSEPVRRKLIHRALIIRERIISMFSERGITGENLALVSAMTLGEKSMLDQEQKQNFMKAGVMHIMAVSGLHAIILSMFVFNLLFFLKGRFNIIRIIITILILWAFAFVTGLTPSVLRATLMFTFLQAGNIMQRKVNGINSVLASAFVLILIRPSVIFDAGFLLSYSAVIYIIMFYQTFYLTLHIKNWSFDKIWQSAVVTLVAQAGTLPLTIMLFNRFPTYFLLTNIIIVPVSSLLIITGCLIPLTFPIVFLSKFIAAILEYITITTAWLTETAAGAAGSNIENIGMTTIDCLLLTVFIFTLIYFLLIKPKISALYPLSVCLVLLGVGTIRELRVRFTDEIIVYNTPGIASVGVRTGKVLNLYSDSAIIAPDVQKHASAIRLKIIAKSLTEKSYLLKANNRKILIGTYEAVIRGNDIKPDIYVITKPPESTRIRISEKYGGLVILSSAVSSGKSWIFRNMADSVYVVTRNGAYTGKI